MAVWRLASLLTLLTSPLLSPGEAKVVSEQAPAKEHPLEAAPYVGSYQVFKYTIRSIVCEASCHPVTWSLGHSVTQTTQ